MKIFLKIMFLLLSYLLGSIPFGYIFGLLKGKDLTKQYSKNIGAANVSRVLGKKYALFTFLLDMLKGACFVVLFRYNIISNEYLIISPALYGIVAITGHSHSIFLKFKGGKCVSSFCGLLSAYIPILLPLFLVTFYIVVKKTKIAAIASLVSLSINVLISIIFIIIGRDFITNITIEWYYVFFLIYGLAFVYYKHIPNIKRLLQHIENKA